MKTVQTLLEELVEKVEEYQKQNNTRFLNIEKVLVALDINMATHMKRSDNLEALYNHIRENDLKEIKEEIKPIQKHVNHVEGGLKLLGALALIVTIIGGLAKMFGAV